MESNHVSEIVRPPNSFIVSAVRPLGIKASHHANIMYAVL